MFIIKNQNKAYSLGYRYKKKIELITIHRNLHQKFLKLVLEIHAEDFPF